MVHVVVGSATMVYNVRFYVVTVRRTGCGVNRFGNEDRLDNTVTSIELTPMERFVRYWFVFKETIL